MSPAKKRALEEGRARAARARRRAAIKRVKNFKAWLEVSADHMGRSRALEREGLSDPEIKAKIGSCPAAPALPSDNDYKIAREEGMLR